ncbi:MAG: 5,10-methylenetetrahydromethanopterin reductase [Candidatus Poriferisodalaceae bacterium]|jgi:5,10-methylenetetrahydromethanopterin reductase
MDTGLMLGFEDSIATITELARQGEAAGCATMYTVEAGRNAITCAAAVIAATEQVRVGTYIVNAYARSPWLAGLAARDLDEMSDGRFVLGVGTGNPLFNKLYMDEDSSKPLAKMRDYIEVLRGVVAGRAGERVRHEGPEHGIRWRATWDPTRPTIPVYLSASGPNMVRLAGEVSDGVGVGIMSSTAFMRDIVRPNATAAAVAAGRDPSALSFPMGALLSVNDDVEKARQAIAGRICGLFHPVPHPYYDSQLRQLGHGDFVDQAYDLIPAGRVSEAMGLVPDEVIDTMTITGTPAECASRIAEYEGLADEIVFGRVPQPEEPTGVAAFESVFELASLVA